eukprot:TRINITY_DN6858_c0_g1_i1.p1 TRINITY_DN6858_c0_g1~~TRINITY_DN6858_c0_g1_i1.p1  ORF type:complete len:1071 (-),score=218.25 TRINITY_DN6858_c0_g1_i1:95-3307(-)
MAPAQRSARATAVDELSKRSHHARKRHGHGAGFQTASAAPHAAAGPSARGVTAASDSWSRGGEDWHAPSSAATTAPPPAAFFDGAGDWPPPRRWHDNPDAEDDFGHYGYASGFRRRDRKRHGGSVWTAWPKQHRQEDEDWWWPTPSASMTAQMASTSTSSSSSRSRPTDDIRSANSPLLAGSEQAASSSHRQAEETRGGSRSGSNDLASLLKLNGISMCPDRHELTCFVAKVPSLCSSCDRELPKQEYLWGCSACDFEVCQPCRYGRARDDAEDAAAPVKQDSKEGRPASGGDALAAITAADEEPSTARGGGAGKYSYSREELIAARKDALLARQQATFQFSAQAEEWRPEDLAPLCAMPVVFFDAEGQQSVMPWPAVVYDESSMQQQHALAGWVECPPVVDGKDLEADANATFSWPSGWNQDWTMYSNEASEPATELVAEALESHGLARRKTADETFTGPDGDVYEVYYPKKGGKDGEKDCDTILPSPDDGLFDDCDGASTPSSSTRSPSLVREKSSAELGIGDVVSYMRNVAVQRYPARNWLFEVVKSATQAALGEHFGRFALVGSTAMCIDTPDSDLDAVVFTRYSEASNTVPPTPAEALRRVADMLMASTAGLSGPLRLQLVDCARVPVLTVVCPAAIDGDTGVELSLDLTVDQPLGEWHVLWFLSQRCKPEPELAAPSPLQQVPIPRPDGWEQSLEAAALRCVKWWLRRRHIPVSKEGGFPSVTWTLMVIHVLRCSLFVNEVGLCALGLGNFANVGNDLGEVEERTLLGAIAAFFDRFNEGGPAGTLLFADGKRAEFWPQQQQKKSPRHGEETDDSTGENPANAEKAMPAALTPASLLNAEHLSVLDPTTTQAGVPPGAAPADLAPRISGATRLLHAYELRRAALLSAAALDHRNCELDLDGDGEGSTSASSSDSGRSSKPKGSSALKELFADVGEGKNTLPASVPSEEARRGVMILAQGELCIGLLHRVKPKPGWSASFLHRGDTRSRCAMHLYNVDVETGRVKAAKGELRWFCPSEFVCAVRFEAANGSCKNKVLEADDLERLREMRSLLRGHGADGARKTET